MCNVIHYVFACAHSLQRRRSHCSGTKHKTTPTRTKAACTAEPFLTIYIRTACGSCHLERWEQAWTAKLAQAKTTRDTLHRHRLPGLHDASAQLLALHDEYTRASWRSRHLFAPVPTGPVARVATTHAARAPSPLARELHPHDIADANMPKAWADMREEDYDGDYIARTDPLHPVSTEYSHPWDDDGDGGNDERQG